MPALSEIHGPDLTQEQALGPLTLAGFISEVNARYPANEALYWRSLDGNDMRWTYAQMYAESLRVARALLAQGVGKGTRVGILISNRPEWIFCMFGAAMAGAVTVALNTFSTRQELKYQLQLADVALLFMEWGVASQNFVDDILTICPELAETAPGELFKDELPFLRRVVCIDKEQIRPGLQDIDDFLKSGAGISDAIVAAAAASCDPVDDGLIFFSSGSTAQPKAVQQTHRAATLQCWRAGHWYEVDSSVRSWSANGFFWSGNFAMALGCTLGVGGCLVLQRYFVPEETLELIEREKVSYAFAWPHQYARLQECPRWQSADLSSLKYVDAEGVLASHPTVNTSWREPNGYGATETFTFVTGFAGSQNTDNSFGPVLPGNIVRIIDPDTGEILPLGETGEIITKGPTLSRGYLKTPPEDTVDREGFFHTADAGYFSPQANLFWKGRLGDIIKTGGANVSPTEIDAAVMQHPAIQSVFTVGVPDKNLGEIVVSCVILREGHELDEEGVRQFAKESLASYKVPRRVLFFSEEDLPMTGSNKIRRPELRKLVSQMLE
jgi:fatty-acyl-CoA synthase